MDTVVSLMGPPRNKLITTTIENWNSLILVTYVAGTINDDEQAPGPLSEPAFEADGTPFFAKSTQGIVGFKV